MNILLNARAFYYLWTIAQIILFIMSGYPQKIVRAFLKMEWSNVFTISDKFFPLGDSVIADYDITEFTFYLFAPLVIYSILSKLFRR